MAVFGSFILTEQKLHVDGHLPCSLDAGDVDDLQPMDRIATTYPGVEAHIYSGHG